MASLKHQEEEEGWENKFFTKCQCQWEQMLHTRGKEWRMSLLLLR